MAVVRNWQGARFYVPARRVSKPSGQLAAFVMALGLTESITLSVTGTGGEVDFAAALALGFTEAVILQTEADLAAAVALGITEAAALYTEQDIAALAALGITEAAAIYTEQDLAALASLGITEAVVLLAEADLAAAVALGITELYAVSSNVNFVSEYADITGAHIALRLDSTAGMIAGDLLTVVGVTLEPLANGTWIIDFAGDPPNFVNLTGSPVPLHVGATTDGRAFIAYGRLYTEADVFVSAGGNDVLLYGGLAGNDVALRNQPAIVGLGITEAVALGTEANFGASLNDRVTTDGVTRVTTDGVTRVLANASVPNAIGVQLSSPSFAFGDIQDLFSVDSYLGTNAVGNVVTNRLNLSGTGGMVMLMSRGFHSAPVTYDTVRGATKNLSTNGSTTEFVSSATQNLTSFNSNGFTLGTNLNNYANFLNETYSAYSWLINAKLFNVVTYTGNGTTQTFNHGLTGAPGMVWVRERTIAADTLIFHRGMAAGHYTGIVGVTLDSGDLNVTPQNFFGNNTVAVAPTSTVVTVGSNSRCNTNTIGYVAYCWAHDTTATGDIQCGTYTGDGTANQAIALPTGWLPQFVMVHGLASSGPGSDWMVLESKTGVGSVLDFSNNTQFVTGRSDITLTSTGFTVHVSDGSVVDLNATGVVYIYMAIRAP